MRSEAPVPTVGQVVAVVDAQLGAGLLRCLEPGCGGRLARWGFGLERDLVGLGGRTGRVRPRRALCAACGVSRVLAARFDAVESRQFRGHFHYAAFGAQLSNWRS